MDAALSNVVPDMKKVIYRTINLPYGLKPEDIARHYDLFYDALQKVLPKQYIQVIREVVRVLHQRTKMGMYEEIYAVQAFGRIITVNLEKAKVRIAIAQRFVNTDENAELLRFIRENDKRLREAERLVAIGQTAGMVGHDIRNPLQSILGDIYLVQNDVASLPESPEKESLKESLDSIQKNINYINKIVVDLQDFGKFLSPTFEVVDLKDMFEQLNRNLPKNIDVNVFVDDDARMLITDVTFIQRILSNLISNAVQAMAKGGKLSVTACKNSECTFIFIKDTGEGIPLDVRDKLFTPLFTTKSKGQGLGLAVVKRMVEALDGSITFESEVGKGATFIVSLPKKR